MLASLRDRSRLVVVGVCVLFAIPFVVALVALASPKWYPLLDLAQTELRVRDVATSNPPLIGLPGRIGNFAQGSHPGPLSFWALWPFYRLFGASAWALEAAAASLNVLAVAATLWVARRRGGTALVLAFAAPLALLVAFYGPSFLTMAWNPYMPLLWFVVFLVSVWSVLCADFEVMPLGVFAGTFSLQTHISYAALVVGLVLVAGAGLGLGLYRADRDVRRRALRWSLIAVGLGVLLWLPPVIQELTGERGNLTIIWEYFTDPPETPIGVRAGIDLMLVHLNPWRLVARQDATSGSVLPGSLLLAAWVGSVVLAWRQRQRVLLRLDVVLAAATVLGIASMARIFGFVWYYLMLWAWGLNALMLLAIGWAVVGLVGARLPVERRDGAARIGTVALAAVTVAALGVFTVDAAQVDVPEPRVSQLLAELLPPTVRALDSGAGGGGGRDGRYLVTFTDTVNIGAPGYGLLLELERQGFDVGATDAYRVVVTPERVMSTQEATATVHLARGPNIATWRSKAGYEEVAYVDLRSARERAEYRRLRARVRRELRDAGLGELVGLVDTNLFVAAHDERLPAALKRRLGRMLAIGQPAAIFVGPPSSDF